MVTQCQIGRGQFGVVCEYNQESRESSLIRVSTYPRNNRVVRAG
jgi:hypothetical protein